MKMQLSHSMEMGIRQTLELFLSPRMLGMLKILNLSYADLLDNVEKTSEENVMLEVERKDEFLECIKFFGSDKKLRKETDFSEYPGLKNVKLKRETLLEHLFNQLELEDIDEKYADICRHIIENLDSRGFIQNYPEVREEIMKEFRVSRPTVDKALKIVQGLEPDGVGARSLKECLLIQIKEHNFENFELEDIISKAVSGHLEDIAGNDLEKAAKALGIEKEGMERIAEFIKTNLNPDPGSSFAEEARQVIPSFAIEQGEEGFKITNLEKDYGPIININQSYLKMLEDPSTDAETLKFLKEKFASAKELIENIAKRHETSQKIIEFIKERQSDFLEKGIVWLKPLLQKEIADKLGLHSSTISRAIAEKYIQTPHGTFPIKILCPRDFKGFTEVKIQSMIADAIKSEEKGSPLSDDAIREKLASRGFDVKRRTVAAYRKKLKLASSHRRARSSSG